MSNNSHQEQTPGTGENVGNTEPKCSVAAPTSRHSKIVAVATQVLGMEPDLVEKLMAAGMLSCLSEEEAAARFKHMMEATGGRIPLGVVTGYTDPVLVYAPPGTFKLGKP